MSLSTKTDDTVFDCKDSCADGDDNCRYACNLGEGKQSVLFIRINDWL